MEKEMNTLVEHIQRLRDKQYIHDFVIEKEMVCSKETNEIFEPENLIIERTYRYEGDSNPDDMTVAYGIAAPSGTKGVIIDAYGTYANPKISEAVRKIPVREVDENQVTS
ncbi:MAG: phosphoribosylpyrophosphate synthetase [bacterium]|nr:phosphoribosylpyrophosphate synthetase [bacterium]